MGNYYIITTEVTEGRKCSSSRTYKVQQVTGVMNSHPGITHGGKGSRTEQNGEGWPSREMRGPQVEVRDGEAKD